MAQIAATISIDDEAAPYIFTALDELEVEDDHRLAAVCHLKLAVVKRSNGWWNFLDDQRPKLWSRLKISVKLADAEMDVFRGYVTEVNAHFGSVESPATMEIRGLDESCLMSLEERIRDWINRSDSDIAREIFQSYGYEAEVESTEVVHEEAASTIIQRETDIQFLKRLARRNGFECFVRNGVGYFRKPAVNDDPQPVLAAHFGPETNLLNFDVRVEAMRPTTVESHRMDTIAKEVQTTVVTSSGQRQLGRSGALTVIPPNGIKSKFLVKHAVATNRAQMAQLGHALVDEAGWFIEGRGEIDSEIYGAMLCARGLVPIKGVGEMFSGLYYVTKVRHVFQQEKYLQKFHARRNALAPSSADDFGGRPALSLSSGGPA